MPQRTDISNWRLTPYITVNDASAAIAFYERVFGATVMRQYAAPDSDKLYHVALDLHGAEIYLSDDFPEWHCGKGGDPKAFGGSPVVLHLDVPDADIVFARALEHGAEIDVPLADQFWGARYGEIVDPFGHRWAISTQREFLTKQQTEEAARKALT